MLRNLRKILVPLTVLAALVTLAAPAYAATWSISIGSATTGSGTYTAAASSSVAITDQNTGVRFTCTSATLVGAVPHLGTGLSGNPALTATASTWNSCTGAGWTLTITHIGTWSLALLGANGSTTTVALTGINMNISSPGCSYHVSGALDGHFNNSTQILDFVPVSGSGHVLTVSAVSGCFGIFANGHTMSIIASYKISAKAAGIAGALKISTP